MVVEVLLRDVGVVASADVGSDPAPEQLEADHGKCKLEQSNRGEGRGIGFCEEPFTQQTSSPGRIRQRVEQGAEAVP
jgi:hypothetical protein